MRVSHHLDACRRCGLAADTLRTIKCGLSRLGDEPDHEAIAQLERFVDDLIEDADG